VGGTGRFNTPPTAVHNVLAQVGTGMAHAAGAGLAAAVTGAGRRLVEAAEQRNFIKPQAGTGAGAARFAHIGRRKTGEAVRPADHQAEAAAAHIAAGKADLSQRCADIPVTDFGAHRQLGAQHQPAAKAQLVGAQAAPCTGKETGREVGVLAQPPAPLRSETDGENTAVITFGRAVDGRAEAPFVVDREQITAAGQHDAVAIGQAQRRPAGLDHRRPAGG
jgi:hypothetical protein